MDTEFNKTLEKNSGRRKPPHHVLWEHTNLPFVVLIYNAYFSFLSFSAPIKQNTSSQKRRDKKNKLPIEREGIRAENPEKYYEFGDEIGR